MNRKPVRRHRQTSPQLVQKKSSASGKSDSVCIVGRNACLALFARRKNDIEKVSIQRETVSGLEELQTWCTKNRVPLKVTTQDELERIAGGKHHEGIAILAKPIGNVSLRELLSTRPKSAVLLADVGNPHNVGAILRVCAFYGVTTMVIAGEDSGKLSSAAMRIAEGGAEHVRISFVASAASALTEISSAGFKIITTSPHAKLTLGKLPKVDRPLFVFGSENSGLPPEIRKIGQYEVSLPGSGDVESLNVACSVAVVLSRYWEWPRQ